MKIHFLDLILGSWRLCAELGQAQPKLGYPSGLYYRPYVDSQAKLDYIRLSESIHAFFPLLEIFKNLRFSKLEGVTKRDFK